MPDNGIALILRKMDDTFQFMKIGDSVPQLLAPIVPLRTCHIREELFAK